MHVIHSSLEPSLSLSLNSSSSFVLRSNFEELQSTNPSYRSDLHRSLLLTALGYLDREFSLHLPPMVVISTDASKRGWGAVLRGCGLSPSISGLPIGRN